VTPVVYRWLGRPVQAVGRREYAATRGRDTRGHLGVKWVETIADGQTVYDGLGTAAPAVGSCA